ncbi:MAG: NAD(P)-dependent oxidoreductase [Candidatus Rokuibacteriota bacterium]|nr:MAG: NAD(P)-dependent oxidoreductase [Candidatus Rokubacteria bacterium]
MRALVIGASGQVGAAVLEALRDRGHQALGTYAHHPAPELAPLNVTDRGAVERAIVDARADWVLCPAGLTHVDHCEEHPAEAFAINRDGALHAAREARRAGAGFVFFSTEYVFDGEQGPYAEDDPARPLSVYGRSKWEGERAILDEVERALVVRTTVVYGPDAQEKNFVYQLIRNCRNGQPMRIPVDQLSSPTYNVDLARATVELCERDHHGVYHLAGDGVLDRFAFARLACEVFALDPSRLAPVATAALEQKAPRPLKGGLRIAKAQAALSTPLRSPEAALRAMRAALEGAPTATPAASSVDPHPGIR